MIQFKKDTIGVAALCALLTLAAIVFRPALPIDETRYLTVAWEMFSGHKFFLPTMNFEPYHHKPPLMFWLVNALWGLFGVHRWAAVLALSLTSSGCVLLTARLAKLLFPNESAMNERVAWVMVGAAPFLIYGTLVMFDFILTFCILLTWLAAVRYIRTERRDYVIVSGLAMGLGVLAKGPVVLIFTLLPFVLAPLWSHEIKDRKKHYRALAITFGVGLIPVIAWLVPVYLGTNWQFFEWLVFRQTAGRVTGDFSAAHVRPFYFYIPCFIALFVPWLFFPSFWKNLPREAKQWRNDEVLRLFAFTVIPAFIVFSLISGKQPHYLVPMTPFISMLVARCLKDVPLKHIKIVAVVMVALIVAGQGVAYKKFFPRYDLEPVAQVLANNRDKDWAWTPNYHGELGFLARGTRPVEELEGTDKLPEWFVKHPGGIAVVRTGHANDLKPYDMLYSMEYEGGQRVVVIRQTPENP